MNWADWAIVVILTLSSLISLVRGFVKEAFSLVIWIVALVAASAFNSRLDPFLENSISTPSIRAMAAFGLIFIAVLLLGALLNYCVGLIVKATGLSGTDRLIGMLFGFARGLFIVISLLVYIPAYVPIKNDPWFQQSTLIPYFMPYETAVKHATGEVTQWVLHLMSDSNGSK